MATNKTATRTATASATLQGVEIKLVKVAQINAELRKVEHKKLAVTISALYHAIVFGNVAFMDGWRRTDATLLDATLRALMPVSYTRDAKYVHNSARAQAVQEKLGIQFQLCSFEEFTVQVMAYYTTASTKVKKAELDAAAIGESLQKSAIALIKKFQANGVSLDAIKTAIILAEKGELK